MQKFRKAIPTRTLTPDPTQLVLSVSKSLHNWVIIYGSINVDHFVHTMLVKFVLISILWYCSNTSGMAHINNVFFFYTYMRTCYMAQNF